MTNATSSESGAPAVPRLLEEREQEARRPDVGGGAEVRGHLRLQLGLTDAAGDGDAPERARAVVEHEAERGQVIGGGDERDVALAEPRRGEAVAEPPEVVAPPLGVVDGAGRHEHAGEPLHRDAREAAERRLLRLEAQEVVLARHRDAREVVEAADRPGVEARALEGPARARRVRERVAHGGREPRAELGAPLGLGERLEPYVEDAAGSQVRHGGPPSRVRGARAALRVAALGQLEHESPGSPGSEPALAPLVELEVAVAGARRRRRGRTPSRPRSRGACRARRRARSGRTP